MGADGLTKLAASHVMDQLRDIMRGILPEVAGPDLCFRRESQSVSAAVLIFKATMGGVSSALPDAPTETPHTSVRSRGDSRRLEPANRTDGRAYKPAHGLTETAARQIANEFAQCCLENSERSQAQ